MYHLVERSAPHAFIWFLRRNADTEFTHFWSQSLASYTILASSFWCFRVGGRAVPVSVKNNHFICQNSVSVAIIVYLLFPGNFQLYPKVTRQMTKK